MTPVLESVEDRIDYVNNLIDSWAAVRDDLNDLAYHINAMDYSGVKKMEGTSVSTIHHGKVVVVKIKFECKTFDAVQKIVDGFNWGAISVNQAPEDFVAEYILNVTFRAGGN